MERVRTSSNNAKEMLLTHLEGAISTDVRSIRVFAALLLKDSKTYRIGMSLLEETSWASEIPLYIHYFILPFYKISTGGKDTSQSEE